MRNPMRIVAAGEAATGLALMLNPPLVVRLLFGADIDGAGLAMARITGMALVALGVACWPGAITDGVERARGSRCWSAAAWRPSIWDS